MFDLCPVNISRYILRKKREPDHNGAFYWESLTIKTLNILRPLMSILSTGNDNAFFNHLREHLHTSIGQHLGLHLWILLC
jgi:hypothetical protein